MSWTRLGRAVEIVSKKAANEQFSIGLEAIEGHTGRLVETPQTEYAGDGIAFREGDILFGKLRPYLAKAWLADRSGAAVGDFHVYRTHAGIDGAYVKYVLLSDGFLGPVIASVTGAKMPRADWETTRAVKCYFPELDEQRAIADFLDEQTSRIDSLIGKQVELIELLRERRAAVVSATFEPGPSTKPMRVGRLLGARPSYGVLVPEYVDEAIGAPFVRVGDLLNLAPGRPLLAIAPEQSDEYARTKIVGGEVLLGVVGKMGQAALAPQWLAGANVARAVAVLRCKEPAAAPILCAWLGSDSFRHQAELATSGDSIQPTLGMADLARFDINMPTHVDAFADLLRRTSRIDTLISKAQDHIALAKERRTALITAAVTGQIDVRTAGRAASVGA